MRKITFLSNYMTHHQLPFCNEMYRILQQDFHFIATGEFDDWRKEQGWSAYDNLPYVIKVNESEKALRSAMKLSFDSDVVICGASPELYLKKRLLENRSGVTLRYSERIYKRGTWRFLSPRGLKLRWDTYYRYHNPKQFMLCASAYTSGDLRLQGAFLGKCYKWGYFPETISYSDQELMSKKHKDKFVLLWCGRFIDWKHPEVAIQLAARLHKERSEFELQMIGSGEEEWNLRALIEQYKLEACVKLLGPMRPEQVRDYMETANIYLFTSDYQEGWGAVLNEAMNSGCAVVASHAAGAVPYLIQDGVNGAIYQSGKIDSLYQRVKYLMEHKECCEQMGRKAYVTIQKEWNAKVAAERLLLLIEDLEQQGNSERFQSGPCSRADIIKNSWYKESSVP